MATDWTSPKTSDTHANELAATRGRDESNARMDYTGDTNIPDGTIRWNKTNNRFEIWSAASSTWSVLSSKYLINVDQVDGYDAGNASGNVPVSNGNVNSNLNADKLDGQHGTYFQDRANHTGTQAPSSISPQGSGSGLDADKLDGYHAGNASGNVPVSNGTVNTNLNADKLDGQHGTFFQARENHTGTQAPSTISPQGAGSGLDADLLDGQHASSFVLTSDYDNADVLAKVKAVDGPGSGLDADTLDGLHASEINVDFATPSEVTGVHTTGSITSGSKTMTVASATGIVAGMYVVGEGIAPGTTVATVSGTTVTLSANAGRTLSSDPVGFYVADKVLSPGLTAGMLCRAWVNFNGTGTVAIRAAMNVSSITDNGTGDYTVNFTTAMPDVNYCAVESRQLTSAEYGYYKQSGTPSRSATSYRSVSGHGSTTSSTTPMDALYVQVAIFR